ncbi:hypothetical protein [Acaryochloris sp. IP29b_bin.148]|uniref:hypothetical protein n=1 Tax=Acaryochloris sp. IP29b_bin.148 TaxID=2969218 RepID=UPI002631C8DB|nr:hypothetical protein [Acaryochloris sp. IP29b_bin.148]
MSHPAIPCLGKEVDGHSNRSPTHNWLWPYPHKGIACDLGYKNLELIRESDRIQNILINEK